MSAYSFGRSASWGFIRAADWQRTASGPGQTTTTLTADHASVDVSVAIALTATVAMVVSHSPGPTGSISFYEGATLLGTAALASGSLSVEWAVHLPFGTHSITAKYNGDGRWAASTSDPVSIAWTVGSQYHPTGSPMVVVDTAWPAPEYWITNGVPTYFPGKWGNIPLNGDWQWVGFSTYIGYLDSTSGPYLGLHVSMEGVGTPVYLLYVSEYSGFGAVTERDATYTGPSTQSPDWRGTYTRISNHEIGDAVGKELPESFVVTESGAPPPLPPPKPIDQDPGPDGGTPIDQDDSPIDH